MNRRKLKHIERRKGFYRKIGCECFEDRKSQKYGREKKVCRINKSRNQTTINLKPFKKRENLRDIKVVTKEETNQIKTAKRKNQSFSQQFSFKKYVFKYDSVLQLSVFFSVLPSSRISTCGWTN